MTTNMARPPFPSALSRTLSTSSSKGSARGNIVSITVRKDDPKAKAGIQLEQDSEGTVTVTNIAKNGLFGDSDLEIGDIMLSVNKIRLSQGDGPEILMNAVHKNKTISISVRKPPPQGSPLFKATKSRSKQALVRAKEERKNSNNRSTIDTYDGGISKHNKDGSLKFERVEEIVENDDDDDDDDHDRNECDDIEDDNAPKKTKAKRRTSKTKTITAKKDDLKTPSPKTVMRKSIQANDNSSSNCVGLVLELKDEQVVVAEILPTSIFVSTELQVGDKILSVNDMSFRKYADAEYAKTVMDSAPLVVTLVVKASKRRNSKKIESTSDTEESENNNSSSISNISDVCRSNVENSSQNKRRTSQYEFQIDSQSKIQKYRPVTVSAPKSRSQHAGLSFRTIKVLEPINPNSFLDSYSLYQYTNPKNESENRTWVCIENIDEDSIFKDTSLKKGDKIISINNVDLRKTPDPTLALKACVESKESIALIVLKGDESVYKEKEFCFDQSVTNLEWKV